MIGVVAFVLVLLVIGVCAIATGGGTTNCNGCNQKYLKNASFCPHCGLKKTSFLQCPCGQHCQSGDIFCPRCGAKREGVIPPT